MAFGKLPGDSDDQPLSEINMIPMIDVMLVLLVIFMVAAPIIARTDLVLTLPERVASVVAAHFPLRQLAPPLPLASFSIHQVWHERSHHDPGHRWLRALIRDTCARPPYHTEATDTP